MMPLQFCVNQTKKSITLSPRKITMNGIALVVFILSMTKNIGNIRGYVNSCCNVAGVGEKLVLKEGSTFVNCLSLKCMQVRLQIRR